MRNLQDVLGDPGMILVCRLTVFSGECRPCGRIKELRSEQCLVLNPRNDGCWCWVSTGIAAAAGSDCHLGAPLVPLWAPQSGVSSNPHSSNPRVPLLPCWELQGGCPSLSASAGALPAPLPRIPESPALPSKAPLLTRAGGKDSSRVCSEQELIKIQKVISLLCPLITGNPGRPDQT